MKLTVTDIDLPEQRESLQSYLNSSYPMQALTKQVMILRRKLRKDMLESKDDDESRKLYAEYWENVLKLYTIERDMSETMRMFELAGVNGVDVNVIFQFLKRTAPLNKIEFENVFIKEVPWTNGPTYLEFSGNQDDRGNECHDYFDSWWPLVLIQLKEDPREVLGKEVNFVNITNNTRIEEADWHKLKPAKGRFISRRIGECPAHAPDNSGVNVQYIYIKDNPAEDTKTVFCFGVPEKYKGKKPEIRVYPMIVKVRE